MAPYFRLKRYSDAHIVLGRALGNQSPVPGDFKLGKANNKELDSLKTVRSGALRLN